MSEDFLSFHPTRGTEWTALADIMLSILSEWSLSPSNLVGLGYGGARNMSGKMRSVQAIIKTEYPAAQYTPYTPTIAWI